MKCVIETITPSVAETYLKENKNNRKVRINHIYFLRDEILGGRWAPNGATIVFSRNRLLDGQHRLLAVVAAKKPIKSLVVTDVPDDYFSTIDTGTARRAVDVLRTRGEPHAALLSPAVMILIRYKDGNILTKQKISTTRIEQFLETNGAVRASAKLCESIKLMNRPAAVAGHYLFRKKDEAMADLFIDGIRNGFPKSANDPFFDFRERMIENKSSAAKLPPTYQLAMMIKAWNLVRKNEKSIAPVAYTASGKKAEAFPVVL